MTTAPQHKHTFLFCPTSSSKQANYFIWSPTKERQSVLTVRGGPGGAATGHLQADWRTVFLLRSRSWHSAPWAEVSCISAPREHSNHTNILKVPNDCVLVTNRLLSVSWSAGPLWYKKNKYMCTSSQLQARDPKTVVISQRIRVKGASFVTIYFFCLQFLK